MTDGWTDTNDDSIYRTSRARNVRQCTCTQLLYIVYFATINLSAGNTVDSHCTIMRNVIEMENSLKPLTVKTDCITAAEEKTEMQKGIRPNQLLSSVQ